MLGESSMSEMHEVQMPHDHVSIFELISQLKDNHDVRLAGDVDAAAVWKVSFIGEPSFRHVNRIAMFRDYLDALLPGDLQPVGAERGSVVVLFSQREASDAFVDRSNDLIRHADRFDTIAGFLGVSEVSFGSEVLKFVKNVV